MVLVESENLSGVEFDVQAASKVMVDVLLQESVEDGWVGFSVVPPERIRALKHEHLGVDEETDVLAFPIDGRDPLPQGMPRHIGDVVLCPQVVGGAWRAPLVHAVLHLVGYDHGDEMEARERAHAR
jgi:ssRNA-specific RNase YbeY (16S rRNA maturation enzyme)